MTSGYQAWSNFNRYTWSKFSRYGHPGLRACWTDPLAFLAEGKADEGFNARIENMVGAFGRMVSAEWWRWQVRVV